MLLSELIPVPKSGFSEDKSEQVVRPHQLGTTLTQMLVARSSILFLNVNQLLDK